MINAAVKIQSSVRMLKVRSDYRLCLSACVEVQRWTRGYLTRLNLDVEHFAASEIQSIWRGYQANVDFVLCVISAIKVQSFFRMASAILYRRQLEDELLAEDKMLCGFTLLQGVVRGFLTRCRRPTKMNVITARLKGAEKRAREEPQLRLGARTMAALIVLQKSKRLAEIMSAISTLEISTRLSSVCCEAFAGCEAPEIVFSLIRNCNRSLPHVELLHHVLLTMSNVAKYEHLLPSMATMSGTEILLDLVQMFRDKDNIFCLAVALLERIVRFGGDEFKDLCRTRENTKRLKGVYALCERKLAGSHVYDRVSTRSTRQRRRCSDLRLGVRTLERIIRMIE